MDMKGVEQPLLKIMKPVVQYGGHDELISQHTKLITAFTSLYK